MIVAGGADLSFNRMIFEFQISVAASGSVFGSKAHVPVESFPLQVLALSDSQQR